MPRRRPVLVDNHPAVHGVGQSRRHPRSAPHRSTTSTRTRESRLFFHLPSFSIGLVLGTAVVLITGYLPELLAPPDSIGKAGDQAGSVTGSAVEPGVRFVFDQILREPPQPLASEPLPDPAAATMPADVDPALPSGTPVGEQESAVPGVLAATTPLPDTRMATTPDSITRAALIGPVEVEERAAPDSPATDARADAATAPQPPSSAAPSDRPADSARYLLQAASFRSRSDAERLRAELLLLDLPASTGEVNIDNSVWYRVTVGPFPDQAASDLARARMRERNLTAIPLHR